MGRGNFIPSRSENYKGFYVDYEALYGENYWENEDDDQQRINYEDFIDNLKCELKSKFKSFIDPSKYKNGVWRNRDEKIQLENSLCSLITSDNECTLAVYVVIDEYQENMNLAVRHLENYSNGLLEVLKNILPENSISCRSSAWTSSRVY